jgi:Raf kinase inhibitor-like YbhB/YbcL family protein
MISRRSFAYDAPPPFLLWTGILLTLIAGTLRCSGAPGQPEAPALELRSASFSGDTIPKKYSSCDGQDGASPQLSWNAPPERTQSFALLVTDKDALFGSFVHWVLYDLPADKRELPEGIAKQEQLPDGSRQGRNGFDKIGYLGPCPPWGSHRYVFSLYALDIKLSLPSGASKKQVVKALKGHILANGELIGRYQH